MLISFTSTKNNISIGKYLWDATGASISIETSSVSEWDRKSLEHAVLVGDLTTDVTLINNNFSDTEANASEDSSGSEVRYTLSSRSTPVLSGSSRAAVATASAAPLVSRIFATGRAQGLGQSTTGLSVNTIDRIGGRYAFQAPQRGLKNVRMVFSPHYLSPVYSVAPNPFTVAAGLEAIGKYFPATFSGASSKVVSPTDGLVVSDVVLPAVSSQDTVYVRTEATMSVGQQVPVGYLRYPTNNTVETIPQSTGQPSQLVGTGVMAIAGNYTHAGYGFGPIALVADTDVYTPSVLVFGDSIADGNGYHAAANDGEQGFIALGLYNAKIPHCKATRGSNRASYSTPTQAPNQFALCQYATHLVGNLGTNDIFTGRTLLQTQTDLLAIWEGARAVQPNIKIYWQLILPRTTSTDSWATTANQTPIAGFEVGGVRDQLNSWLYAKVADGTLDGVINILNDLESATTPGVWVASSTPDGVHPGSTSHITVSARITSTAMNWWYRP